MPDRENEAYLGDGVYAWTRGKTIRLRDSSKNPSIVLYPVPLKNFLEFVLKVQRENPSGEY